MMLRTAARAGYHRVLTEVLLDQQEDRSMGLDGLREEKRHGVPSETRIIGRGVASGRPCRRVAISSRRRQASKAIWLRSLTRRIPPIPRGQFSIEASPS